MEVRILKNDRKIDTKYVDVLDGVRAISIIIVMIFHFWQQTWIWPTIQTPFLSFIGITKISFNHFAQAGYLFVDMMVLISGFLLFLPLARHILMGEDLISWKQYARKRVARILPSYLFCVITLFIYSLALGSYNSIGDALIDLLTHLTFTQTLFGATYMGTMLNVVLWTLAIEVWFYILFPFIASLLKRNKDMEDAASFSLVKAIIIAAVMFIIFSVFKNKFVLREGNYLPMWINQFPAFMGVYAIGMIGALVYVGLAKNIERNSLVAYISFFFSILSIVVINEFVLNCSLSKEAQLWQINNRTALCTAFIILIISLAFSPYWFRWLFSNKFMRFLSGISYNLYIWHQWLAVQLKQVWRIPYWTGTTPPNQLNDSAWQWKYAIIITVVSFAVAILVTYLIEKPFSNIIMGKPAFGKKAAKKGIGTTPQDA